MIHCTFIATQFPSLILSSGEVCVLATLELHVNVAADDCILGKRVDGNRALLCDGVKCVVLTEFEVHVASTVARGERLVSCCGGVHIASTVARGERLVSCCGGVHVASRIHCSNVRTYIYTNYLRHIYGNLGRTRFYACIRQKNTVGYLKVWSWDRRTYAFCSPQLLPGILQFLCCAAAHSLPSENLWAG